jgi:hypothetical protein
MDPRYNSDGRSEQPGLEVVSQPGLEPVILPQYDQPLPEFSPTYFSSDKQTVTTAYKSPVSESLLQHTELGAPEHRGRRKRPWLIVGGIVAVIVILAAVLGGVLGSRAANSSSGDSSASRTGADGGDGGNADTPSGDATSNTTSTTTTRPQSIRQGSGLSVAGWRKPDGSAETYLFFQDPQDGLRYSRCDTSRRSPGNDTTCWASPFSFNSYAKAGTRLGASTILWGDIYQVSLPYSPSAVMPSFTRPPSPKSSSSTRASRPAYWASTSTNNSSPIPPTTASTSSPSTRSSTAA